MKMEVDKTENTNDKTHSKAITKIKKLLKRRTKYAPYNLSGSAWQDYYTSWERERLYRKNEKLEEKQRLITNMIFNLLESLLQLGYAESQILESFDEKDQNTLSGIFNLMHIKTSSKKEGNSLKK